MRLAFCLFKYFPYGGMQRDFRGIALACLSAGFEIDVFTLEWEGERVPEFNIHIIRAKGLTNHQRYHNYAECVAEHIARNDYAAVIGFNKIPYLTMYFAADSCYKQYLKQRPFFYQLLPRYRRLLSAEQEVFCRDQENHILAIAYDQIREYQLNYHTPDSRFTQLPPWIKPDRFYSEKAILKRKNLRERYQIAEDDYLIVAIGSGFRSKGLDRSLLALASLPKLLQRKMHFIIIGQDKFTRYKRKISRLELTHKVSYLGGRSDIPDFLFGADLLLHPAYKESAGIVLLESVVAGLPVLTTESCGYAHYVKRANAGIVLHEPFSQYDLNRTLCMMLTTMAQQPWVENGIRFGLQHRFSKMPTVASNHIKHYVDTYAIHHTSSAYIWQNRQTSPCIAAKHIFTHVEKLQGEVYREVAGRKTLRFVHDNQAYFAKIHFGVSWKEIIKDYLQFKKPVIGAQPEFYALQRLAEAKVNSLEVVASGWRGNKPAEHFSFIITKALEGTDSLENILASWDNQRPDIKQQYALIKAVAKLTRDMHAAGVNHRDYYSCHILVDIDSNSGQIDFKQLTVSVLDLHRAQLRQKVPLRWLVKDLGGLLFSVLNTPLTKRHWFYFIREYQQCSLRKSLQHDSKLWHKVLSRADQLQRKAVRKQLTIAGKPYERRILV